jgi:hypothetical protein
VNLPRVTPMPLARFDAPFEHRDWIFEPKLDGFRAVAYVEGGACHHDCHRGSGEKETSVRRGRRASEPAPPCLTGHVEVLLVVTGR